MKNTNFLGLAPQSTFKRTLDNFFNDRYLSLLGLNGDFTPAIKTAAQKENYQIEIVAPGLKKEELNVKIKDGSLAITFIHKRKTKSSNSNYLHESSSCISFSRSISLPEDVDDEHISAEYEDGILRIHLPREAEKVDQKSTRTVPIR